MAKKKLKLIDHALLEKAAECLKVMAHPTRLKIVDVLMQGEFAVHEIAEITETTPNQTCEHLGAIHRSKRSDRKGKLIPNLDRRIIGQSQQLLRDHRGVA